MNNLFEIFDKRKNNIKFNIDVKDTISLLGQPDGLFEDKKNKIKILKYDNLQYSFHNELLNRISLKFYSMEENKSYSFTYLYNNILKSENYIKKELSSYQYDIIIESNNNKLTLSFDKEEDILLEVNIEQC